MRKISAFVFLFLISMPFYAQSNNDHEVTSEVKELSRFHTVIYKIWHTGWPKKDINLLASLAPQVDSGFIKIKNAVLPGIMRDKKAKWDDGVKVLGVCVEMYKVSASKKDSVALLNAAEKLHAQFENMVRIVNPPVKEVEEFHQVLYMLYHHYMPQGNYEKIKEAVAQMNTKIVPMKKAELPKRLKPKAEKFIKYVEELSAEVDKLNNIVKADYDKAVIDPAIEKVHSRYLVIEKLFE